MFRSDRTELRRSRRLRPAMPPTLVMNVGTTSGWNVDRRFDRRREKPRRLLQSVWCGGARCRIHRPEPIPRSRPRCKQNQWCRTQARGRSTEDVENERHGSLSRQKPQPVREETCHLEGFIICILQGSPLNRKRLLLEGGVGVSAPGLITFCYVENLALSTPRPGRRL